MEMQSGRGREYTDGVLGSRVAKYPLAYANQEAYADGTLGAMMAQPGAYNDGMLGAMMAQPGAYNDGMLGAMMPQPGVYNDGSLGMVQPTEFADGIMSQGVQRRGYQASLREYADGSLGAYARPRGQTGFSTFHHIGLAPRSPVTSPYRATRIPKFHSVNGLGGCASCSGLGDATTDVLPWALAAAAVGVVTYFLMR